MDNKSVNFILDNYKGVRRDRALKVESGLLKSGDKEYSQFVKNEFIRVRRMVIKSLRNIEKCEGYRKTYLSSLKYYQEQHDIVQAANIQILISEINELISESDKVIADIGGIIADILKADIFSEHEICQLLNINNKSWEENKARYFGIGGIESSMPLVYSVLLVTGPEYRWRKGRMKEFYDCPESEMPIYWAVHRHIMEVMKNNEEFHRATNKKFEELFPDLKKYKLVKDLEGNIIKVIGNKEE